jgi:glycosyltransferase involved in cell wall biosynthesis
LVERGNEVDVLVTRVSEWPGREINRLSKGIEEGVRFEYTTGTPIRSDRFLVRRLVELRGWARAARRLSAMRRHGRLDCVYLYAGATNWSPGRSLFLWLLRLLRVPVVLDLCERPWSMKESPRLPERIGSPLARVAGVVAISSVLADWARSEFARLGRRGSIMTVPILLDRTEFDTVPAGGVEEQVLFASSTAYPETLEYTMAVMGLVWASHPSCRLIVTGWPEGTEPPGVRAMDGDSEGRVTWAGFVPRSELLELYRRSSVLLAPLHDDIRSEARFPTKIAEYLGSGRPVVTTSVGEISRYLTDGETAFVAPQADVASFARKICEALDHPARADAVGEEGARLAVSQFDYSVHAERFDAFLRGVCGFDDRPSSVGSRSR